jgi:hypothetical protein
VPVIIAVHEAEIRMLTIPCPISQKKLGLVVYACHPRKAESVNRRMLSRLEILSPK